MKQKLGKVWYWYCVLLNVWNWTVLTVESFLAIPADHAVSALSVLELSM